MEYAYEVSIIIPSYNEGESIQRIIKDTFKVLNDVAESVEIIVINDGSTDNTKKTVEDLLDQFADLSLINISNNRGKSPALMDGFEYASGRYVGFIDADYQFVPDDFVNFLAILKTEDVDVVNGYREKRQDNILKRIPSKIFNFLNKITFGTNFKDWNSGIKLMKAEVADKLLLRRNYHRYILGLAKSNHFSIKEVPITHKKREFGKSKYGPSRFMIGLFDLISIKAKMVIQKNPFLFFGFLGSLLVIAGSIELIYTLYLRFVVNILSDPIQELLLGVLLILFGAQLFVFGYMAEKISDIEMRQTKILKKLEKIIND